jgi:hypothetical protein
MARKIDVNEYRRRTAEEASIELEFGDGDPFVVPAFALWPDEVATAAVAGDLPRSAELIMGESEWARFRAEGGTATLLFNVLEAEGMDLGKSPQRPR